MAIVVRTRKDGVVTYQAIYRDTNKKQKSAGSYSTRKAARNAYDKARGLVLAGKDPATQETPGELEVNRNPRKPGELTVGAWADWWLPRHDITDRVRASYQSRLNKYILPRWKDEDLAEVTPGDIQDWFDELKAQKVSYSSRQNVKITLSALFTAAVRRNKIKYNPVSRVKLGDKPLKPRRKVLTKEQFAAFLENLPEQYRSFAEFITEDAGMRIEETLGLQEDAIEIVQLRNTETGEIIEVGEIEVRGVILLLWSPMRWEYVDLTKNRKTRVLRIEADLARKLKEGASRCNCKRGSGCGSTGKFVFLEPDGSHLNHNRFAARVYKPALARAGLPTTITPRDMRRFHASWMRAAGASWEVIRDRLGHGSIQVTEIYVGEVKSSADAALEAVRRMKASSPGHL